MEEIEELLELCIRAKEFGIDCFFFYFPHINKLDISVHKDGWNKNVDFDKQFYVHLSYLEEEQEKEIVMCRNYITNLIKEKGERL